MSDPARVSVPVARPRRPGVELVAASLLGLGAAASFDVHAQSSVAVFGTVDVNARVIKNDGSDRRYSLSNGGLNAGQFGFRGSEDLGDGLRANFLLVSDLFPDSGSVSAKFFNRQSYVGLSGLWGEFRAGRDYTPTYWNITLYDPFGTVGLGSSTSMARFGAIEPTYVRADNSVSYSLPSGLGGFFGQLMAAAGEGSVDGKYVGGRAGYADSRLNLAIGAARQDVALAHGGYKIINSGISYDFGVLKLTGEFHRETLRTAAAVDSTERLCMIGLVVPLSVNEIHASWVRSDLQNSGNDGDKFSIGVAHSFSKRTAIYATVSEVNNKGAQQFTLGSTSSAVGMQTSSATALPVPGGKSRGAEIGIRHFF